MPWTTRDPLAAVTLSPGVYMLQDQTRKTYFVGNSSSLRGRALAYRRSTWAQSHHVRFVTAPSERAVTVVAAPRVRPMPQPMAEQQFWSIIDHTRRAANIPAALMEHLRYEDAELVGAFASRWQEVLTELYDWRVWDVAYVMHGGCSDDSFEHFRSWLIMQGPETVSAVIDDPVGWALALARLSGSGRPFEQRTGERASYVAPVRYESVTGTALLCTWPSVGGTPRGQGTPESEMFDRYADLAKAWQQR